jgi:DnaJ family protein C protein 13
MPSFKDQIGMKVVRALQRNDDGVTQAAVDMLCTLMQPMHDNFDLAQESDNKKALLASKPFLMKLAALLKHHTEGFSGALVVNGLLDFFTFALCPPYRSASVGG